MAAFWSAYDLGWSGKAAVFMQSQGVNMDFTDVQPVPTANEGLPACSGDFAPDSGDFPLSGRDLPLEHGAFPLVSGGFLLANADPPAR
jgi:hypothetical protein